MLTQAFNEDRTKLLNALDNLPGTNEYSGNTVPVRPLLDATYSGMGTT